MRSFTRDYAANKAILNRVKTLIVAQALIIGITFAILLSLRVNVGSGVVDGPR